MLALGRTFLLALDPLRTRLIRACRSACRAVSFHVTVGTGAARSAAGLPLAVGTWIAHPTVDWWSPVRAPLPSHCHGTITTSCRSRATRLSLSKQRFLLEELLFQTSRNRRTLSLVRRVRYTTCLRLSRGFGELQSACALIASVHEEPSPCHGHLVGMQIGTSMSRRYPAWPRHRPRGERRAATSQCPRARHVVQGCR